MDVFTTFAAGAAVTVATAAAGAATLRGAKQRVDLKALKAFAE